MKAVAPPGRGAESGGRKVYASNALKINDNSPVVGPRDTQFTGCEYDVIKASRELSYHDIFEAMSSPFSVLQSVPRVRYQIKPKRPERLLHTDGIHTVMNSWLRLKSHYREIMKKLSFF